MPRLPPPTARGSLSRHLDLHPGLWRIRMLCRRTAALAFALISAALLAAPARADVVATGDVSSDVPPANGATLNDLGVGNSGAGTLTIDQASTLAVSNAAGIGGAAGSSGLIVVTGTG